MIWFINVFYLSLKELRCVLRDRAMMGAILISFTVAVYVVAVGAKADVTNVTIGIIDHDQSGLSQRIRAALQPPMFQTPGGPHPHHGASGHGRRAATSSSSRSAAVRGRHPRPATHHRAVDGGRHRHGPGPTGHRLHHRDRAE